MLYFVQKHSRYPSSAYYNGFPNGIHGDEYELLSARERFSFTVLNIFFLGNISTERLLDVAATFGFVIIANNSAQNIRNE